MFKKIIIEAFAILVIGLVVYFGVRKMLHTHPIVDRTKIEIDSINNRIKTLEHVNDSINLKYKSTLYNDSLYLVRIDSLKKVKTQIKTVYVEKTKEVSRLSPTAVHNELNRIFPSR